MTTWINTSQIPSRSYVCGFCNNNVASATGYNVRSRNDMKILICPHCSNPSYFKPGKQVPQVAPGNSVENVPENISNLYLEARNCISVNAYTSSVLACRKLLMNIGVAQGADEGENFFHYVEYLADNGFIPPNGRGWVDHIRLRGNEATHEIEIMEQEIAEELITFVEMLLKFIFEFPARVPSIE